MTPTWEARKERGFQNWSTSEWRGLVRKYIYLCWYSDQRSRFHCYQIVRMSSKYVLNKTSYERSPQIRGPQMLVSLINSLLVQHMIIKKKKEKLFLLYYHEESNKQLRIHPSEKHSLFCYITLLCLVSSAHET